MTSTRVLGFNQNPNASPPVERGITNHAYRQYDPWGGSDGPQKLKSQEYRHEHFISRMNTTNAVDQMVIENSRLTDFLKDKFVLVIGLLDTPIRQLTVKHGKPKGVVFIDPSKALTKQEDQKGFDFPTAFLINDWMGDDFVPWTRGHITRANEANREFPNKFDVILCFGTAGVSRDSELVSYKELCDELLVSRGYFLCTQEMKKSAQALFCAPRKWQNAQDEMEGPYLGAQGNIENIADQYHHGKHVIQFKFDADYIRRYHLRVPVSAVYSGRLDTARQIFTAETGLRFRCGIANPSTALTTFYPEVCAEAQELQVPAGPYDRNPPQTKALTLAHSKFLHQQRETIRSAHPAMGYGHEIWVIDWEPLSLYQKL